MNAPLRPKRIAIDFNNDGVPDSQGSSPAGTPSAAPQPAVAGNPTPGSAPGGTGGMLGNYDQLAQSLLGGTGLGASRAQRMQGQGSPMGGGITDLVRFSGTPQGRAAIQGAIDNVIARGRGGADPNANPYQTIIQTLRQAMGGYAPTA